MTTSKTPRRLYLINGPKGERLVEAHTAAAAVNHCVRTEYACEIAKPMAVAKLVAGGMRVETAGEEPAATDPKTPPLDGV